MIEALVAQRLVSLRSHLSERLGTNLTLIDAAERAGIPPYKMQRLESGKGSWETLITVLTFYRSQGYNLDWILLPDNSNAPMVVPSGNDLLVINDMVVKFSKRLESEYRELSTQLRQMGYIPLEDKIIPSAETDTPMPAEFDLS
ncbi:hypothetical protein GCM10023189_32640 [Nibrella saemangeumensis]|uniref:HTH cro/C1-type domain-containing protein n=2 Tax=Nibrella saemangeumensis TaxID=1084526 RepID=A0ABP8N468_9BACT